MKWDYLKNYWKTIGLPVLSMVLVCFYPCAFLFFRNAGEAKAVDMLPFFGRCHIGYIPRGQVFGVSKLARLVDCFARRLQIQERLTQQIASYIKQKVDAEGVGVVMECHHLCMMMRGVEKQNSCMVTSAMLGSFLRSAATRNEFLRLIHRSDM